MAVSGNKLKSETAKFGFAGLVATGLNLGKREYNGAIFTSLRFGAFTLN